VGKPGGEPSGAPASRQTGRKIKSTSSTTPAASIYNITVDTDGLKPQDDTATV